MTDIVHSPATGIRDVIRYLKRFKKAILVVKIDDDILDSPVFHQHGRDLAMIAETGIQLIIVPAAKSHIDAMLMANNITWEIINGVRVTADNAMPFIKMASFEVSNRIMNYLSAEKVTGVTGNWVRARGVGIVNGINYGTAGQIESLNVNAIRAIMSDGIVPVFSCIGWSTSGKSYNISSEELTREIAIQMNADKVFYLSLTDTTSYLPVISKETVGTPSSIPLENIDEAIKKASKQDPLGSSFISFLISAKKICKAGVKRVHLLDGRTDGAIPCELFSENGTGIMVYSNRFGQIRNATTSDIQSMLALMQPFVERGILLPRTAADIETTIHDYIVYDIDEEIRAVAALHIYEPEHMAEIAAVCVSEQYVKQGIGQEVIHHLIHKATAAQIHTVFVLTTQTADWFESFGFSSADIQILPSKRKALWTPERGSKMYILHI